MPKQKTVKVPVEGEIIPDKKLGNKIKWNFPWRYRQLMVEDLPRIYEELQRSFSKEAIQEGETRDGRKLIGIKEQFITNRFNDVLGLDKWHYDFSITTEQYGKVWMSICDIRLMIGNWKYYEDIMTEEKNPDNPQTSSVISMPRGRNEFIWLAVHENTGGCYNLSKFDSKKGAITNAFKKCAAKFGVGKEAYEGMDDEDLMSENGDVSILQHQTPQSVKVEKTEPLPVTQGNSQQQKTFNDLLTELNGVHNLESLIRAKELMSKSSGLTPDQDIEIKTILSVLQATYEK